MADTAAATDSVLPVILGMLSGILGFAGLFLPVVRIGVDAFGVTLSSATMTIWGIADLADQLGEHPGGVYLLVAIIAIGSFLIIVGPAVHRGATLLGILLQGGGAGYLAYEIWIGGFAWFGIDVTTSPEIGMFVLLVAPILALVGLALEFERETPLH